MDHRMPAEFLGWTRHTPSLAYQHSSSDLVGAPDYVTLGRPSIGGAIRWVRTFVGLGDVADLEAL